MIIAATYLALFIVFSFMTVKYIHKSQARVLVVLYAIGFSTVCIFTLIAVNHAENALKSVYESEQDYLDYTVDMLVECEGKKTPSIYDIANEIYGVPQSLIYGIEMHETKRYTSDVYLELNNTYGCRLKNDDGSYRYCQFETKDQSTIALAKLLHDSYGVDGEDYYLSDIQERYCPTEDGCENWIKEVRWFINEFKDNERGN